MKLNIQNHTFPTLGKMPTLLASDLHQLLHIIAPYENWINAKIQIYHYQDGLDYIQFSRPNVTQPGQYHTDTYITLGMAKELAVMDCTERGKIVRQAIIYDEIKLRKLQCDHEQNARQSYWLLTSSATQSWHEHMMHQLQQSLHDLHFKIQTKQEEWENAKEQFNEATQALQDAQQEWEATNRLLANHRAQYQTLKDMNALEQKAPQLE